ncbi:MAG: four helix bundle protein [Bacteroidales bacterium]|nr:four helix bundle protein [Bacteroidales bacterium]
MNVKRSDLADRLTDFSVRIIRIAESLPVIRAGSYIADQIIRSGTSPALNYGDAQDAESNKDFIHKIKIVLKELRETSVALQLISKLEIFPEPNELKSIRDENNQLIAIFVASVKTAKNKIRK